MYYLTWLCFALLARWLAGNSTAAYKEESPAGRAENPLLQQRPARPMRPSASRAQTSPSQRSKRPSTKLGTRAQLLASSSSSGGGSSSPIGRRTARGLHAGEDASTTPRTPVLPKPALCCLDPSASCTTAPLPSDDNLPCCPDPAAAPSARAGSVLIAFWTRVYVTVVHTMLPLVCLVELFGEH